MLDYTSDPEPFFSPEDATWVNGVLRNAETRR
jgi:hypothetical protein